jgi:hypothetical protein
MGHRASGIRKRRPERMATGSNPPSSETPILNVVGERVALGPLREDLLPLYGRWINDPRESDVGAVVLARRG